jgi:hypothetical protein
MPKRPARQYAQTSMPCARAIRLLMLPDVADPEGMPRPVLLLPDPRPETRPVLRAFSSAAAALAVKGSIEAGR